MLQISSDLESKRERLFALLRDEPYGTLWAHQALEEVLEEQRGSGTRYHVLILQIGKRLEVEAQRALRSVRGIGYRIINPNEHLALSAWRTARAKRQQGRSIAVLEAVPTALLTPEERRRVEDALHLRREQATVLRRIAGSMARSKRATDRAALLAEEAMREIAQQQREVLDRITALARK